MPSGVNEIHVKVVRKIAIEINNKIISSNESINIHIVYIRIRKKMTRAEEKFSNPRKDLFLSQ